MLNDSFEFVALPRDPFFKVIVRIKCKFDYLASTVIEYSYKNKERALNLIVILSPTDLFTTVMVYKNILVIISLFYEKTN